MLALLFVLALQLSTPAVTLTVSQQAGAKNVHLRYRIAGPYEGRVCVDIDSAEGEHATAFCANDRVSVAEGKTLDISDDVHGPLGTWVLTPALPDTPGDDDVVYGEPQYATIVLEKSA